MTDDDGLDSRLSAYLDGELEPAEVADVQALLESSPEALLEFDRVREARDMVRELPLLEPPPEVAALFRAVGGGARPAALSGRPRRRARTRAVVMSVVATAAFWGVVVSSPGLTAAVSPSLDSAVAAHSLVPDGSDAEAEMSVTETDMPSEVGGSLYLVHSERIGRGTHAVYSDGSRRISVFEEPGRVDWRALPAGSRIELDGSPGWHGSLDGYDIVVVERGRSLYTIVAEPAPDEMMDDVGVSMPADEPSLLDRIREASNDVTRVFGLRG
ncbi:MAG: hypothetical protein P8N02_01955 [Actinomycetota bacterium]|nr:hypothetical protein [Actinomycetota bacterium]